MKKLWLKIKTFFSNPARVLADAKKIVKAMRMVRSVLGTPAANNLVKLIPGYVDDRILEAVKKGLDTVLKYADALQALDDVIPKDNKQVQNAIIHKSASAALRTLYPKMDEATADLLIQKTYTRVK